MSSSDATYSHDRAGAKCPACTDGTCIRLLALMDSAAKALDELSVARKLLANAIAFIHEDNHGVDLDQVGRWIAAEPHDAEDVEQARKIMQQEART